MKQAIFLGLYYHTVDPVRIEMAQHAGWEVWAINDWHCHYPWLTPDEIWQIHPPDEIPTDIPGRWAGQWRVIWDAVCCPVRVCYPDEGLARTSMIDMPAMEALMGWRLRCTVCYMLADAVLRGYDTVRLEGMRFVDEGERETQLPYVLAAMDVASAHGLTICMDGDLLTEWRGTTVDWTRDETVPVWRYHWGRRKIHLE